MIPSQTLRKFLASGTKPASAREITSLLDECRSLFAEVAAGRRKLSYTDTGATMSCLPTGPTSKPATKSAAPAARPYQHDRTDALVVCVRKNYFTGQQLADAQAELAARNVTIGKTGYSISSKTI